MEEEYKNIQTENLFMNKQDYYNKYRPSYDKQIIEILKKYGLNRNSVIADYGAGTGKFADLLTSSVNRYYFVEPNKDMIDFAINNIKASNVLFLNEKAEETSISENIVDFAFAVHSFHYFEKDKFKLELQKSLKKDGYFCIIWYDYIDINNPIQVEWQELIYSRKGFVDNHNKKDDRINIYVNSKYDEHSFMVQKEFTYQELLGLGLSVSSTPLPNQKDQYVIFEQKVKDIFNRYKKDNKVVFNLKCNIQIGKIK